MKTNHVRDCLCLRYVRCLIDGQCRIDLGGGLIFGTYQVGSTKIHNTSFDSSGFTVG